MPGLCSLVPTWLYDAAERKRARTQTRRAHYACVHVAVTWKKRVFSFLITIRARSFELIAAATRAGLFLQSRQVQGDLLAALQPGIAPPGIAARVSRIFKPAELDFCPPTFLFSSAKGTESRRERSRTALRNENFTKDRVIIGISCEFRSGSGTITFESWKNRLRLDSPLLHVFEMRKKKERKKGRHNLEINLI